MMMMIALNPLVRQKETQGEDRHRVGWLEANTKVGLDLLWNATAGLGSE